MYKRILLLLIPFSCKIRRLEKLQKENIIGGYRTTDSGILNYLTLESFTLRKMNKLIRNPILYFFVPVLFSTCSKEEKEIKFDLSTSINPELGGRVYPSVGSFDSGEEITLTAKPSKGFKFKSWDGDFSSETNPLLIKNQF